MFKLDFAARTDRGLVRKTNQDVACVVPALGLALVADGMGGHHHGDIASRTAADAFVLGFERFEGAGDGLEETTRRLQDAFRAANLGVARYRASLPGAAMMGTTLVVAAFAQGHAVIGNVGDSRCYRLRDDVLEVLTRDHSYASELRRAGAGGTPLEMEAAAQWTHVLTRCINGDGVAVDTRVVRHEPGDVYLLCSDGLWGSASENVIAGILGTASDATDACDQLIGAAWAGGALDNIGIAVVHVAPSSLRVGEPPWLDEAASSTRCGEG